MNDDELSRLFRSLDEPAEPRPAFGDELFSSLERLTASAGQRRTSAWLLVAAALLLVAAFGTALAVGSGLIKVPFVVDLVPSSASPSPSAPASATPMPSPTPGLTPTGSPSPTPRSIAIDGIASSTVDGLTVRAMPGTAGDALGTIDSGQRGFVLAGPVSVDGYVWYQLTGVGLPPNADCPIVSQTHPFSCPNWLGWVAAGSSAGDPWLAPVTQGCPSSPMNLEDLMNQPAPLGPRTALEQLACYGSSQIRVRGWWPEIPSDAGLGGTCGVSTHPSTDWLSCSLNYNTLAVSEAAGYEGASFKLFLDPASGLAMPPRGQWLEVVGHFDDASAQQCAPTGGGEQDPARVVLACRASFVADSISPANGPY